jgi:hypothetical protein
MSVIGVKTFLYQSLLLVVMNDIGQIIRKFERMMHMTSEQNSCRDYVSSDERARLTANDRPPIIDTASGEVLGTFVYDLKNQTEEFIPSENYKSQTNSEKN